MLFNKISKKSKLNLIYKFCQTKKYVPLRPLINDKNLVYVERYFKKVGRIPKLSIAYYYALPILASINNYFTSWSTLNTGLFCTASLLGIFLHMSAKYYAATKVFAL